jgi:hypothetical protein
MTGLSGIVGVEGWDRDTACESNRRDFLGDSGKDQFSDTVSATPVHFDTNQVGLPTQPVHTTNTTFPASHNRAAPLVRPPNSPLRLATVSQGFPLIRSDPSEERDVNRVQYVQIRNNRARDGRARVRALGVVGR